MNSYTRLILIISIVVNQVIISQENSQTPLKKSIDTISFKLTKHNNISIQAILNRSDTVNLMFHTAANGITLTKKITKKLSKITWVQGDSVNSWGGQNETRYSKNNSIQIGSSKWNNISIWENENSGPGTVGKFGPDLFQGKTIEIDFDKSVFVIHESLPKKIKEFKKLKLIFENDFMFIKGTSNIGNQSFSNKFLIHSGYGGTILYDDNFVKETGINDLIEITEEQELKDSYGNVLKTLKGKLPGFEIGVEEFKNIPVGFFDGSISKQKMSIIGGNLLKRFNLIIDSTRKYLYIKSNQLKDLPY